MKKAPKVGDRVKLKPDHRYYPCTGTVTKIWPKRISLTAPDDPRWDDNDFYGEYGGPAPEGEWHVSMKVDSLPKDWAYVSNDTFCPCASELEKE